MPPSCSLLLPPKLARRPSGLSRPRAYPPPSPRACCCCLLQGQPHPHPRLSVPANLSMSCCSGFILVLYQQYSDFFSWLCFAAISRGHRFCWYDTNLIKKKNCLVLCVGVRVCATIHVCFVFRHRLSSTRTAVPVNVSDVPSLSASAILLVH